MSENVFDFFNHQRSVLQVQNRLGENKGIFQHPIKTLGNSSAPLKPNVKGLSVRKPLADRPILSPRNFNTPQPKPVTKKLVPSSTIKIVKPKKDIGQIIYKDIPDIEEHIWPESECFNSDDIVKILNCIRSNPAPPSPKVHFCDDPIDLLPSDLEVENLEMDEIEIPLPLLIDF